jgi:NAD(P)-dependent dehydrogenase (short-subunit alcohol dehydrogenase family)
MRPLSEQVVVVTGASSGIGRTTAQLLGPRGASVALLARNEEALHVAAEEVRDAGGTAEVVVADVSDWSQVNRAREQVLGRFGRIDGWVNNAGVAVYAEFVDIDPEEMRRVIEVNLLGEMYGTKAALDAMRIAGSGVIVNVSSALARRSVPLQSAYCAAKHGITGFTESVRLELQDGYPGIHIVEVLPSSMNTPLFTHARSKMRYKPMPIPPIYDPSVVAEAIVHSLGHPSREVFVGGSGKLFEAAERVSPALVDAYLRQGNRGVDQQISDRPDDGRDNLFAPMEGPGATRGDWPAESKQSSLYTKVMELHPARTAMVAAAAVGAASLAVWKGRGLGGSNGHEDGE